MAHRLTDKLGTDPARLRDDLVHGDTKDLRRRRAIVGFSLLGMAAMTPVSLLQTGIVKHLPDPSLEGFHSDKANLSDTAYQFGVPDGTLVLASLAANLPLAAYGGRDRAAQQPWVPLAAAGKAAADALGAGAYFYQMLSGNEPWCAYCVTGALANFAVLMLSIPEAVGALKGVRGGRPHRESAVTGTPASQPQWAGAR